MASKSLGRLRQWAGEKISTREKVIVNDEFQELEKDVELRRAGIQRLMTASEGYQHALSKKKLSEAFADGEKMIPIDSLGLVMINHGEEYSTESQFGTALIKFGRAHCKIATLQEAYALTFKDTFIQSLDKFKDEIREFESLKKKLENRRIICDTSIAKFEKLQNSKKEKDKREAEDEMERAKQRYEETAEDMRAHMHAIQENEHNQLHELTLFLDLEMNFVQSYMDILKDVKADWQDRSDAKRHPRNNGDNHIQPLRPSSKASFVHKNGRDRAEAASTTADSSEDEGATTPGRAFSNRHSRSGSTASKPPSRPASRLSRKRTNSTAASATTSPTDEKEESKDTTSERSRRMSVAGWASSAVGSVTGGRGSSKKSKDKDSFAALDDDNAADQDGSEGVTGHKIRKSSSFRGLASFKSKSKESLAQSPKATPKILKPPSLDKKVVRAIYDFSGSSDELSFKAGVDILVLNEVLDDWWMGELPDGKKGLFPTSYTVPSDGTLQSSISNRRYKNGTPGYLQPIVYSGMHGHDEDHDHYLTSDADDEHIIRAVPMPANKSPAFYGGFDDRASVADSTADSMADQDDRTPAFTAPPRQSFSDDNDIDHWFAANAAASTTTTSLSTPLGSLRNKLPQSVRDSAQQPLINRSYSADTPFMHESSLATPTKKIPPPPPPRRVANHNPAGGPPIPERKVPTASSILSHGSSGSYDRSPFDSAIELAGGPDDGKCTQFRQNPFKPKGMCSNCLEFHD
ncbi:BAR-domain-containing protein [Pholiota conissans]|uniref:BAR-domain-containing protein n=1 Tax=Pholiota conissans TaxID=109636 RepID=A0A9P5YXC7_9AGAR|nr:BAR-domain-containing protein [Pholiota conissans]